MFHKCSEKCLCAGGGQQGGKETVLYCYGEVRMDLFRKNHFSGSHLMIFDALSLKHHFEIRKLIFCKCQCVVLQETELNILKRVLYLVINRNIKVLFCVKDSMKH